MELSLLPLLPTFFIIITLTLIIKKATKSNTKLPPSPRKLPFFGNLHNLINHHVVPPRTLAKLSLQYGPVMHLKLGQIDHIVISTPESAREILKTHDINFASRPELIAPTVVQGKRDIVFAPYGSYWRQLRKICVLELLSARRVRTFRSIREQENSSFIKSMASSKSPINLTEKLLLLSNTVTALAAFGTECKHAPRFIMETSKAIKLASGFHFVDLFPSLGILDRLLGTTAELERIRREFDEILDEIVEEHHKRKLVDGGEQLEDLLDVLMRVKDQGGLDFPLTLSDIKAVTIGLFIGGTETSATTLTWAMAELMLHPVVMEKVQGEVRQACKDKGGVEEIDLEGLQYMKLVIKETLRLHPPVPLLVPRICRETTNVGEFEIPAGARLMINAWAIGRDPRYWEDAESFWPERFELSSLDFKGENFQYLPFGGGRRICPGMGFGLANVEITLALLLFHFNWELPEGKELDMTESFGATMTKKSNLCLIASPWSCA